MNRRVICIGLGTTLAFAGLTMALAQDRSDRPSSGDQVAGQLGIHATAIPLDAPIDAASYVVGPGDLFSVSISTVPPQMMALTVTAQGTLVIPLVGEVSASGKNLAAFQSEVVNAIGRRYLQAAPSVSLVSPRRIVIRVRGAGVYEGSYVVSAADRVQTLLARSDIRRAIPRPDPVLPEVEWVRQSVLRRSIKINRPGRESIEVDLERYEATRDPVWSPYLLEGDEVIFSPSTSSKRTVTVGGAVVLPGTFEWKPGDRVGDLIRFAKGLSPRALPESIQVFRGTGAIEWHTWASESAVEAGDRLLVLSREAQSQDALVTLEGEVAFPGQYPIMAGRTRLSEVIVLAGGVTAEAMVHAANIFRAAPSGDAQRVLLMTAHRGNAALEDTAYVRMETQARLYGERVSTNVVRALADVASEENVVLQPDDRIVVPRRTRSVYVFGQVRRPGHVTYKPGSSLNEYIDRAGGMTDRAKEDEVSVIKYASRQWLSPENATIEEGDMIWVPRVVERDMAYNLSIIGQVAGIVSAAATLILLVVQLGK